MSTLSIEVPVMEDYGRGDIGTVEETDTKPDTSSSNVSTLSVEVPAMEACTTGTIGTVDEPVIEFPKPHSRFA
ncbi:hypothetical protein BELL_0246g00060 [Botrytis elliptica]|uniref:Uncharacterized protein n=1 Tax=Botrytis elliptica TaxID=278938 RepID=A0A4Z1K105_9HELO|nr:hypothetical protein EAE99_003622 [Botrytis elliptica]TGO74937.1 hypothetical protein BELL_0246g00060 [Botrytis elliptica]